MLWEQGFKTKNPSGCPRARPSFPPALSILPDTPQLQALEWRNCQNRRHPNSGSRERAPFIPPGEGLDGRGLRSEWTRPTDLKSLIPGSKKIPVPGATSHRKLGVKEATQGGQRMRDGCAEQFGMSAQDQKKKSPLQISPGSKELPYQKREKGGERPWRSSVSAPSFAQNSGCHVEDSTSQGAGTHTL